MGALDGKAVVITGAGAGLGLAYALHAASEGASVVVNDLAPAMAEATAAAICDAGGSAVASAGSVADWDQAAQLIADCLRAFGKIDGLVNNAGVVHTAEPWTLEESDVRVVVETNLIGSVYVGIHALRAMVEQGSGSIVNNTSSAQLGLPQMGVYGATKGGLASLTYSWALDTAVHGVRVNAYSPVAVTAMVDASPMVLKELPSPADNAPVVSYLLSDLSRDITGQVLQRRGNAVVVMSHPDLTEHAASPAIWTLDSVAQELGPVLRAGLQPVGDPRVRAVV